MDDNSKRGAVKANGKSLPFGLKFWYGVGDVGSNIFIVTSGMFLLFFLTNVVGVEPALAGVVLIFPKLWDVISDPIMGGISDVTRSRMGRRRPYLLYSSVPFGLVFFILFLAPHYDSELLKAVHVGLFFALACTIFTVFNVPYSSMVAEMSDDYNERMSITSFRMIGSSVGVLLAGGLVMELVKMGGGKEAGFRFMGIVLGSMITLFCLICFWGTKRARTLPPKDKMPTFKEQVRVAVKNFPFLMLMSMYLLQSVGIGVLMAGLIYYVKYVLNLPETDMGKIFPVLFVTAILFIPVWVKIGKKFGKIKAYRYGLGLLSVMLITLFFSSPSNLTLFYIQIFFLGIGFSSFQLFPFSMLPDTIEYDEMQSGMRREGIFCGVWASGQKTAYSVGPAIVGFSLSLAGFVKGSEIQPETVAISVRIVFSLFTSLMLIISLIPFSKYELTEERFDEIKRLISKKAK